MLFRSEKLVIVLTDKQRVALQKLWFIYGNNGKKHTYHNHRYIQNILEHGENTEEFYRSADSTVAKKAGIDWSTQELTEECVSKVKEVLGYLLSK